MPYQPIELTPGIDIEKTPVLNSAGWSYSAAIRFFEGLPQKIGGWSHLNSTLLRGTGRGMHSWGDNSGNPYIAVGTESQLSLLYGGTLYEITPIRQTDNVAVNFSTVISSKTVTIKDATNGSDSSDYVNIVVPVSVGGLILQGIYEVTVVDANDYTITAGSNATATVNNGGAVPEFTTSNTHATVTVTLANHGLVAGNTFMVQVSTTGGGVTLSGLYSVIAPVTTNTFTITASNNATSSTSFYENGGNARFQYYIHSGLASASYGTGSGSYGGGNYGGGPYGGSSGATVLNQLRYWSLDHFGQDLVAVPSGNPIYIWQASNGPTVNAVQLNATNFPGALQAPLTVNYAFVASVQEMIIALGCDNPATGLFDPNLVRWCDAGDYTDWEAETTNQAGSFRIPSGSQLISGIATGNFNVLWTDHDMWVMSYLGQPFIWSFNKIADAVDIIGPHAGGVFRNTVVWPSRNGFYLFDGAAVRQLECPVWDKFWFNLNQLQAYKINAQVNSFFGEISWGYPSATGNGEVDSRITYNIRENSWTFDSSPTPTARVTWADDSVYTHTPIGVDLFGLIQQHEVGNDADGAPLIAQAQSGWFALSDTDYSMLIERLVGDLIATGGNQQVSILIETQMWPTGPITAYGPFTWTSGGTGPPFSIVRARGRLARLTVSSTALGVFWRLGRIRALTQPSGRGY